MAATVSGAFPVCLEQDRANTEDGEAKKKQVALMEKLRSKRSPQHRSWTDSLMKSFRTSVVDRKLQADSSDRNQVQQCLYTLQRAMKVISQQSLLERLEGVARHQGLTFDVSGSDPPCITLQADMFYIEIVLIKGGGVQEVKIAHQGDATICSELTDILSRGDFPEFTSHLEGLQSIYGVTGEKKLKSKVFLALQSLEKDLNDLAQFQSSISGVANYIHKSPVGILLPRTAGKPMKLIYFVSPYDLLDKKTMSAHPMTVEAITEHGLGRSVTVCLEPGPANKLQTMPLLSVSKSLPSFNGLTHANSANLPACFVLVLPQPIPVAMSVMQNIQNLTKLDTGKDNGSQPLLSLILDSNSGGKMKNDQQLFVSLPDQHHRYFINGVSGGILEEPGVMLSRIPFSHPTHVPKILNFLRQQLLFNSLLASCVRPAAKKDSSSSLVFEMTVISLTQMMVVFEHPAHDTMVTADIDMSDLTNLRCHMLCTNEEHRLCSDDNASLILQRCLSLPILLRSLVRKGRSQLEKLMAEAKALAEEQARLAQEAALWAAAQRQQQAHMPPNIPTKGRPPPPQPPPPQLTPSYPPTPSPITSNPPSVGELHRMTGAVDYLNSSPPGYPVSAPGVDESQDKKNSPLLVNLLDSERGHCGPSLTAQLQQQSQQLPQGVISDSPMLSKLLEDNISVATNITPVSSSQAMLPQPQQMKTKGNKGRKRRMQGELQAGRSPKQRVSDSDASERYGSIDFESSSSPFESSLGSGSMTSFHHPMGPMPSRPPSQGTMSGIIDLTEENMPESSLKKLVDMSSRDMKPGATPTESELHMLLSQQDHNNSPSAGMKPNQMSGSKNENASTSPEGLLTGSGEVGKASLPDPAAMYSSKGRSSSRSSPPAAVAAFLGHGQGPATAPRDSENPGFHQQPAGGLAPQQELTTIAQQLLSGSMACVGVTGAPAASAMAVPRPKVVSSSSMTEALDIKPSVTATKKQSGLKTPPSADYVDKRGLFEKFDFTGQSATSPHVTITSTTIPTTGVMEGEDLIAPKVRLKLHPFRTPQGKSQSLDSGVVQSPSSAGSKSSNSNTFDFRSDEDDDEPVSINYVPSERHAVFSSSPTRLQITSKSKLSTPVSTPETPPPAVKPEKYKRRDKSSGTTKRKKDRDESKKEKKKKKFEHDLYHSSGKEPVYRASTVESDQKSGTKLKIRVSKEHIKMPSPSKESGRMDLNSEKVGKFSEKVNDVFKKRSSTSSPTLEKLVLQKQDIKDHSGADRDAAQLYRSALSASSKSLQKTVHSGKGMVSGSNNTLSKSDPKLAKATIRLKPLNISSSTSTSVTVTPSVKTLSSGRSISERRSQSSSSAAVTTPTSSTMSLASILPNAPTASSVASLPPIPKRPKVSTVNATASAATTITTSAKPSAPVANNINRNLSVNSSYNNAANKMSGNSPGIGGRSGSNLNTSSAHKPPGMGYNKTGSPAGILKTSSNMPGHKISKNTGMPQGILKNSGNVSQGSTNSVKINTAGNQGVQKSSGGSNQLSNNSYNRGPGSTNPAGPQKTALSGHGVSKNLTSQSGNAFKGSGIQGNLSRGQGNQSFQKGPMPSQGGVHKSNMVNQGEAIRNSSSPSQNMGSQKMGSQGKISSANTVNAMHRNLSQGGNLAQGSSNSAGTKLASALPANSVGAGPNQKLAGGQARSLPSGGGCSSSPSTTSRPAVNMRNNSVSGSGGGSPRVPPNHLPVNRSMSLPGQKTGSGSNPRTPSNLSPSNPSAPRFPGQPSQQKNPGSSPSGSTPRSSSTVQTSGQRSNSSSSQNGSNPRSSSNSSQRPSTSSPQTQRPSSASLGSSPTQRPASTPSLATDVRPPSTGATQTPGYPVRPSSAGPRQGSSPLGSRQTSSPGQRLSSSPSGSRTSSPNSQAQRGGGGGASAGVSPLATSRQSPTGPLDVVSVSRPNSSGSVSSATSRPSSTGHVNSPVVSRQNTSGIVNRTPVTRPGSAGSQDPPVTSKLNCSTSEGSLGVSGQTSNSIYTAGSAVSRQSSAAGSNTTVVSRQNSSCGVNATQVSQQSSTKTTPALLRQSSSGNLNSSSSAVFRQNSSSTGGASVAPSSRQSFATDSKTVSAPSVSRLVSSSSVSVAMSRQTDATSGTTSTSGKQLSSGSTASSSANVSTSRTSGAVTSSAQRTSSGSSVGIAGGSKSVVTKPSLNGASGSKTNSGGGGAVSKGASAGKTNATTTSIAGSKTPPTNVVRSPLVSVASSIASITASKGEACSSNSESSASPINSFISGSRAHNTTSFTTSAKLSTSTSSVSSLLSSSLPGHLASSANKTVSSGAARGRKGSLSAIVDKLATKVSASSVPALDNGESLGIGGGGPSVVSMSEGSAERRKNAMEEGEAAEQKTGVKRSASLSGLSPPSSEQKLPRVESHKPASMAGAPLPAHTTPPHSSPSLPTALPGMERHPSGAVAEKNNPFHSRDCADIGLDLSMPKDKVRLDAFPASSLPSHVDAKGRISPKDSNINTVSPGGSIDRGGTKFNGDSNRDRSRSENDIFKVPTPKTQCSEEVEERSSGCGSGRPVSSSNSHPLSASGSPLSDASSSGDDLIIDCGGESPNLAASRPASSASSRGGTPSIHPSPKRVADLASEGTASGGLDRASPGKSVVKTSPSSNVRGFKNSPQSSPHPKLSSNQTSPDPAVHEVHVNSPCEIDDELMNEALGFNPS